MYIVNKNFHKRKKLFPLIIVETTFFAIINQRDHLKIKLYDCYKHFFNQKLRHHFLYEKDVIHWKYPLIT